MRGGLFPVVEGPCLQTSFQVAPMISSMRSMRSMRWDLFYHSMRSMRWDLFYALYAWVILIFHRHGMMIKRVHELELRKFLLKVE
jgi:hypothetical protein